MAGGSAVVAGLVAAAVVGVGGCSSSAPSSGGASAVADGTTTTSPTSSPPPPSGAGGMAAGGAGAPGGASGTGSGSPPPGPGACATAPTGDWEGTSSQLTGGAGSRETASADVRWTLVSTIGCVDRYQPSGTARFVSDSACGLETIEPGSGVIQPNDGALVIDRSTSPPTYRFDGRTRWTALFNDGCRNDTGELSDPTTEQLIESQWAVDYHGSFDGAVLSGRVDPSDVGFGPQLREWRFTRVGAVFSTPTGGACAQAPTDRWTGTTTEGFISTSLTWTRTETTGCVDRFEPTGTATQSTAPSVSDCTMVTATPLTHAVAPSDGRLEIDRGTNPPTFRMTGVTFWTATATCTLTGNAAGEIETIDLQLGSEWANFGGSFDGDAFSGGTTEIGTFRLDWSLQRQP